MNFIARFLFDLQEMSLLAGRAVRGIFKKPHYIPESIAQMGGTRMGAVADHPALSVPGQLSSFGEDTEGEIWMSSRSNNAIYRIEAM